MRLASKQCAQHGVDRTRRLPQVDAAGRILVPPALRRYAGLEKRVVLVGQGLKLELWDEVKWQAQIAQSITFQGGLPPGLGSLSL